jgi:hypothetical protein
MIAAAFFVVIFAIAAIVILLVRGATGQPRDEDASASIVTDWDIAQAFEKPEPEAGRVDYRWLNLTGFEDE